MAKEKGLNHAASFKDKVKEDPSKKVEALGERNILVSAKLHFAIFSFILISLSVHSQFSISGYLNAMEKGKIVYLSLLRYNEENAIYPEQILMSTKTDQNGFFEFSGKLLSDKNMLYRIHCNLEENSQGLDFQESGEEKNYHNFIFSNSDTLFFPKGNDEFFNKPQNSNSADKQWRKSIIYELSLLRELSENQNSDAINQTKRNYLNEFKFFCSDSLTDPLVRLLAFSHIKRNVNDLNLDFTKNSGFYYDIQKKLNNNHSGTSYSIQFNEEISRLSASIINRKYLFQKKLNLIMGFIILVLLALNLILFRNLQVRKRKQDCEVLSGLTAQEEKIAKLVSEGKSNNEIADQLFISLSTVKTHIGNINSKLKVTNRVDLITKMKNHTGY